MSPYTVLLSGLLHSRVALPNSYPNYYIPSKDSDCTFFMIVFGMSRPVRMFYAVFCFNALDSDVNFTIKLNCLGERLMAEITNESRRQIDT